MDVGKKPPQRQGVLGNKHSERYQDVFSPLKNPLIDHCEQSPCEQSPWKERPAAEVLARDLRGSSLVALLCQTLFM